MTRWKRESVLMEITDIAGGTGTSDQLFDAAEKYRGAQHSDPVKTDLSPHFFVIHQERQHYRVEKHCHKISKMGQAKDKLVTQWRMPPQRPLVHNCIETEECPFINHIKQYQDEKEA